MGASAGRLAGVEPGTKGSGCLPLLVLKAFDLAQRRVQVTVGGRLGRLALAREERIGKEAGERCKEGDPHTVSIRSPTIRPPIVTGK
jgi:hypothetical protein